MNKVTTEITPETQTPTSPELPASPPEQPIQKSSKKKWLAIAGAGLVLIVSVGIVLLTHNKDKSSESNNLEKKSSAKASDVDKVKTYEECLQTKNAVVEANSCMTEDGTIYFASDVKAEIPEESTDVVGSQSATLDIGPSSKSDPDYLYGIGTEFSGMEVTKVLLTTSITDGSAAKKLAVRVSTKNVDIKTCSLSIKTTPDKPGDGTPKYSATPTAEQSVAFNDGTHTITLKCPTSKKGEFLTVEKYLKVTDAQPELCKNFSYSAPASSTASSASALRSAMNGTWTGCVDTPWWPDYHVVVTFNQDGTYNAYSDEDLDGYTFDGGFYFYNTKGASSSKVFGVNSLNSGAGKGYLDVIRMESGVTQRGELSNIKLSGSNMTFDYRLTDDSEPLQFKLKK